jgi:hypothetical protein
MLQGKNVIFHPFDPFNRQKPGTIDGEVLILDISCFRARMLYFTH